MPGLGSQNTNTDAMQVLAQYFKPRQGPTGPPQFSTPPPPARQKSGGGGNLLKSMLPALIAQGQKRKKEEEDRVKFDKALGQISKMRSGGKALQPAQVMKVLTSNGVEDSVALQATRAIISGDQLALEAKKQVDKFQEVVETTVKDAKGNVIKTKGLHDYRKGPIFTEQTEAKQDLHVVLDPEGNVSRVVDVSKLDDDDQARLLQEQALGKDVMPYKQYTERRYHQWKSNYDEGLEDYNVLLYNPKTDMMLKKKVNKADIKEESFKKWKDIQEHNGTYVILGAETFDPGMTGAKTVEEALDKVQKLKAKNASLANNIAKLRARVEKGSLGSTSDVDLLKEALSGFGDSIVPKEDKDRVYKEIDGLKVGAPFSEKTINYVNSAVEFMDDLIKSNTARIQRMRSQYPDVAEFLDTAKYPGQEGDDWDQRVQRAKAIKEQEKLQKGAQEYTGAEGYAPTLEDSTGESIPGRSSGTYTVDPEAIAAELLGRSK